MLNVFVGTGFVKPEPGLLIVFSLVKPFVDLTIYIISFKKLLGVLIKLLLVFFNFVFGVYPLLYKTVFTRG